MKTIAWFFPASYRFIAPRGIFAHIRFGLELPRAFFRFVKFSRKDSSQAT